MDRPKELVFHLAEYKIDKLRRAKMLSTLTNAILIILILSIGYYVVSNIEEFKELGSNVCKLCFEKTEEQCAGKHNCYNKYFAPPQESLELNLTNLSEFDVLFVQNAS